ncbi:MAG: ABC transporter substrate-binding protein [Deltaproteobacteria bacterium]|nr:ABC transporter substrate-binding protein [Deltaproteobacteria bacterium]
MLKLFKYNPLLLTVLTAFLLGFILTGCGSEQPQSEVKPPKTAATAPNLAEPELTVLKVPISADPTIPEILIIGDELGFYQKNGIKLNFVGAVPTTQHVAAVVSGEVDISPGKHVNRTIAGIAAGAKIRAIAAKTETTERVPHMIGIVPKDSPIKVPTDLVGKKIGIPTIGGCNEYTPYGWLSKFGLDDPKNQVEVIALPEKNLEQVLRQGEIDLAMTHKLPEEINRANEFRVVFSDFDVWGADGGATPFIISEKFIQANPEKVKAFVAATAEAINWTNEHPQEAREITARRTNTDLSVINEKYFAPNALIKPETVTVWIDLLEKFGEIKPGLKAEQIYTNEFNPYN